MHHFLQHFFDNRKTKVLRKVVHELLQDTLLYY
jgi:hypothetical protein